MTLHKEGTPSILLAIAFAVVVNGLLWWLTPDIMWLRIIGYALSGFLLVVMLQFFRKPARNYDKKEGKILCPADGKVVAIEEVEETEYFKDKRIQVSVFMSPINVHINWLPVPGIIKYARYHPGKYLVAWHPKSSTENERTTVVVEPDGNPPILLRQIAGALARRIVFYTKEGDRFEQGQEFGFIKFGSRVDLLLPLDCNIEVEIGQVVQGRRSVIASFA